MKRVFFVFRLWVPVIIWCSLIFYFSSVPNLKAVRDPKWDELVRSFLHLVFYVVLSGLFFRAINFAKKKKAFFWPIFWTCLYALSDEIHQTFVPTRTFQVQDLLVDWSGAGLGSLIIWKVLPKAPAPLKHWANKLGVI